jgi:phospholipase D1/2
LTSSYTNFAAASDYVRFYNLRTYDRINAGETLRRKEEQTGTSYAVAGADHDDIVDSFGTAHAAFEGAEPSLDHAAYTKYQAGTNSSAEKAGSGSWDTVSSCYMLNGPDIRTIPWNGDAEQELEAFVSEQLYVHSKVLIADDRVVICGSANLNDRSMKGTRDSEICLWIEDLETVSSTMNGKPYQARKFAATMRRYLFRKHLGLLSPMDMQKPDSNFHPAPTPDEYDYGSVADKLVEDPLGDVFLSLWHGTARTNTESFWKVFAPAPDNSIKTWAQYVAKAAERKLGSQGELLDLHLRGWGHVMRPNFPAGQEGARQVKEILSNIRGTLVEMPLEFMQYDNIELLMWNPLTEVVAA